MAQSGCTIANGLHKVSDVSPCHAYSSTGVLGSCFRNLNELDSSVNNPTVNKKHPERLTNAVLWSVQEEEHSIPLTYRANFLLSCKSSVVSGVWIRPQSPGKRTVPGSNPGRSLGHFYRSVIPHTSRYLTFKHLMPLIWLKLPLNTVLHQQEVFGADSWWCRDTTGNDDSESSDSHLEDEH